MPKNQPRDLITDQEMAFARLVLSGMNDRDAAQAAGLSPRNAAYTKSMPRVRAYMLEHRAAMQQQFAAQEAEAQRRPNLRREQVLDRLWEIANMCPDMTRGSLTAQVKALSMIVAMEGFIPDRRAGSSAPQRTSSPTMSTPDPGQPHTDAAGWLAQEEDEPGLATPPPAPGSVGGAPSESAFSAQKEPLCRAPLSHHGPAAHPS